MSLILLYIADHLLRHFRAIGPDELPNWLSESILYLVVQYPMAHSNRVVKSLDIQVRTLILFLDDFQQLKREIGIPVWQEPDNKMLWLAIIYYLVLFLNKIFLFREFLRLSLQLYFQVNQDFSLPVHFLPQQVLHLLKEIVYHKKLKCIQ